jgi:hypothetical protein
MVSAMPALSAGRDDPLGEHRRIRVPLAVPVAMQVVEFRDRRVAVLEHLDVELLRDRLDILGLEPIDERVHGFAPRPEIVRRMPAALGEPRHGALRKRREWTLGMPGITGPAARRRRGLAPRRPA